MRTLILVNTLNSVSSYVYSNHIAFFGHIKKQFPNDQFFFFTPPRMSVDMARNTAAKQALALECDYLMFIDDDVLIPENTLEELISCNADIAGGLVIIRGYPFNVMAFKRINQELPYFNDLPEIVVEPEINGIKGRPAIMGLKKYVTQEDGLAALGFSCTLINTRLLLDVDPPYFITGPRNTEDVYFCLKAYDMCEEQRKIDPTYPELKIVLNTDVQCGHFLQAEPIEWKNRKKFQKFYEDLSPEVAQSIREGGRDLEYIKRHLEVIA